MQSFDFFTYFNCCISRKLRINSLLHTSANFFSIVINYFSIVINYCITFFCYQSTIQDLNCLSCISDLLNCLRKPWTLLDCHNFFDACISLPLYVVHYSVASFLQLQHSCATLQPSDFLCFCPHPDLWSTLSNF